MSAVFDAKTHHEVWQRAWPIILANLSVPLLGAVDTAVIGHLPDPSYLGSVAIGAMIFNFLYWSFGFLRMGTTGFVAQAAGADDANGIRTVMAQSIILGLGVSFCIILLQQPVIQIATYFVSSTAEVEQGATAYFNYRIWGAPAVLMNYAFLGLFIGLGNTRAALVMQISMNLVNIILDFILVIYLDMKVPGVAIATVIAEYSAILIGLFLVRGELSRIGGRWIKNSIYSYIGMRKLLSVNFDIFIRTVLLIFAFAYFTIEAAKRGEEFLAATAVLMNFVHFLSFGLDGFAQAAEGLVGKAVGGKQRRKLEDIVVVSSMWAFLVSFVYAAIYILFGEYLIRLLTDIETVRMTAYIYLPWVSVLPLVAVWPYQLDGIFTGAMQSKAMRNGMVISFVAYFISIHVMSDLWGTHGLWAALIVFMAARGLTLAAVYPKVRAAAQGHV